MSNKKFWMVVNVDECHPNQSENRCKTLKDAEEKASYLVNRYPHLTFIICEARKIVRVKKPVEIIELE